MGVWTVSLVCVLVAPGTDPVALHPPFVIRDVRVFDGEARRRTAERAGPRTAGSAGRRVPSWPCRRARRWSTAGAHAPAGPHRRTRPLVRRAPKPTCDSPWPGGHDGHRHVQRLRAVRADQGAPGRRRSRTGGPPDRGHRGHGAGWASLADGGAALPDVSGPSEAAAVRGRPYGGRLGLPQDRLRRPGHLGMSVPCSIAGAAALVGAAHARGPAGGRPCPDRGPGASGDRGGADGLAHMFLGRWSRRTSLVRGPRRTFVIPTLGSCTGAVAGRAAPHRGDPLLRPYIRPPLRGDVLRRWSTERQSCEGTAVAIRQLARHECRSWPEPTRRVRARPTARRCTASWRSWLRPA